MAEEETPASNSPQTYNIGQLSMNKSSSQRALESNKETLAAKWNTKLRITAQKAKEEQFPLACVISPLKPALLNATRDLSS